ncbi:hypothetical protein [Oceanobacillus saliphilus]|uniref:hypothetical protein n=1 Tax=Oceanobacillus saliphilus TaxID=2925834 RepID=UPI00201DC057|nr:hypothetical protein [Oceanobacillus saliphilus]
MTFKKLTLSMMIAILSAGLLVGCGSDEESPEEPATEDSTEQPAETEEEEQE